ncbi:MAG TPA: hypothetical protein VMR39_11725 [Sphingobium sp.]|nr:hypothetical protein [Sphingobium sp.]
MRIRAAGNALPARGETGRTTIAAQRQFRPAVSESQLHLPPSHGYLLLPDGAPVVRLARYGPDVAVGGAPRHPDFVRGDPEDTLLSRPLASEADDSSGPRVFHDPLV